MKFIFSFLKYDITHEKFSEIRWHFNALLAHTKYELEEGSGQKLDLTDICYKKCPMLKSAQYFAYSLFYA